MNKDELIKKNLDLHAEWMRYVLEYPEVLDRIPKGAELVIIPNDAPELAAENHKVAEELKSKGMPYVIIRLDLPKPPKPKIEIFASR